MVLSRVGNFIETFEIRHEDHVTGFMKTDANLGRIRVLHLEDTVFDRLLVAAMLEDGKLQCEIKTVQSQAEFTAALEEVPYDLIISDFALPSYNGLSALAAAKAT